MSLARISCDGPCPAIHVTEMTELTVSLIVATVVLAVVVQLLVIYRRQRCETEG